MKRHVYLLLVVAASLLLATSSPAPTERSYITGNFALELDGTNLGALKSVEGGEPYTEVISEPTAADGTARKRPGSLKYESITLQCGFGMGRPMYDWIRETLSGKATRRNGAILFLDYHLQPKSRLSFTQALITEVAFPDCDGSSKEPSYVTVKLTPISTVRTSIEAATGSVTNTALPAKSEAKIWLPSSYRLSIDGLDDVMARVNKIQGLVIRRKIATSGMADGRASQQPGPLEVSNITITTAESNSASLRAWEQSFLIKGENSADKEKTGTLDLLSPDRTGVLLRLAFRGLGLVRLTPDKAEANADQIKRVRAEMYCENIQLEKLDK